MKDIVIVIPAYKPQKKLIDIISELLENDFLHIIVIDDGSKDAYSEIFEQIKKSGVDVISHAINMGKGRALKTAFNFYLTKYPNTVGLVTVDADGQHTVMDILKVSNELSCHPDSLIMGCRSFSKKVPFRSRLGNSITKFVYRLVSGIKLSDTQTGLRGIPHDSISKMLTLPGERYEYEMSMLMELKHLNLNVIEVPIETVYENNNEASHFNPLRDSWLVYKVILGFVASSIASFVVDYLLFSFLITLYPGLLIVAEVGARIVSSLINFIFNRKILLSPLNKKGKVGIHLLKYYTLAVFILVADYLLILLMSNIGVNVYAAKFIAAVLLYVVNFLVQKRIIFK